MKSFSKFIVLISFLSGGLSAQAPKFSNDFLNLGVGARGLALGSAVSSISNDVTSAYWNPATLVYTRAKFQVGGQHAQWYSGIGNYDYAGVAKSLDNNLTSFGALSLIRMGIDDIPNTLRLRGPDGSIDYSRITSFSVADYALLVSYARFLKSRSDERSPWSLGANFKLIHRAFGSFAKAYGFGLDAGISYRRSKFSFSLMARDITTTFNAYKFSFSDDEKATLQLTGNEVPSSSVEITLPKLIIGMSYKLKLGSQFTFVPNLDIELSGNGTATQIIKASDFGIDPRIGLEFGYKQKVFLRLGSNNFQSIPDIIEPGKKEFSFQPSGGLGLKFGRFGIDYALTNIGNVGVGLYSHYISLIFDF